MSNDTSQTTTSPSSDHLIGAFHSLSEGDQGLLWETLFNGIVLTSPESEVAFAGALRQLGDLISWPQLGHFDAGARRSLYFITKQFGKSEHLNRINEAIWSFFKGHPGRGLRLSDVDTIASHTLTSPDNVMAVLSLLSSPTIAILACVCLRDNKVVTDEEIAKTLTAWWRHRSMPDADWEKWANDVIFEWNVYSTIGN